ncbi:MAG: hypothetical protein ACRDP4_15045, partial [Nocardioidaceae bacterium]
MSFVVRRGAVLVHPWDIVAGYRVTDGKAAKDKAIGSGDPVLPGPQPDEVWVAKGNQAATFAVVHLDGSPAGRSVPIPRSLG